MKKIKLLSLLLILSLAFGLWGCAATEEKSSSETEKSEDSEVSENVVSENSDESENSEEVNVSVEKDPTVIRVGGLKGPTSMGMIKLMKDNKEGNAFNNYEFTIEAAADSLSPLILQGKLDIAAVPTNLASVLYNRTEGKIKLLAVNTLGVLYMVKRGESITMIGRAHV